MDKKQNATSKGIHEDQQNGSSGEILRIGVSWSRCGCLIWRVGASRCLDWAQMHFSALLFKPVKTEGKNKAFEAGCRCFHVINIQVVLTKAASRSEEPGDFSTRRLPKVFTHW